MADSRFGRTEANRIMNKTIKLMRGAFLAVAVLLAAPLSGMSVPLAGAIQSRLEIARATTADTARSGRARRRWRPASTQGARGGSASRPVRLSA